MTSSALKLQGNMRVMNNLGLNRDFSNLKSMHICLSLIFPEGYIIIVAAVVITLFRITSFWYLLKSNCFFPLLSVLLFALKCRYLGKRGSGEWIQELRTGWCLHLSLSVGAMPSRGKEHRLWNQTLEFSFWLNCILAVKPGAKQSWASVITSSSDNNPYLWRRLNRHGTFVRALDVSDVPTPSSFHLSWQLTHGVRIRPAHKETTGRSREWLFFEAALLMPTHIV